MKRMPVRQTHQAGGVPVKIWTDDVDEKSLLQLGETSRLPIVVGHVAAMPDVHLGIGATVGSVIATDRALIPAAVGVDIGCGMCAARLDGLTASDLPDNLKHVRRAIERAVPVGKADHRDAVAARSVIDRLKPRIDATLERHPDIRKMIRNVDAKWPKQIGTLGSGNHFIELCVDTDDGVWVMLHSGSRGIGNVIGRYFTKLALDDMRQHDRQIPENKDLAYVAEGSPNFDDYVLALGWAQEYALENRRKMLQRTLEAIRPHMPLPFTATDRVVQCHHNYVAEERHFDRDVFVTRKGAIRAESGDWGIIPGSMGAKSYIVRGKGAADSLNSCAHGAGRRMSRTQAKRTFSARDLMDQTAGVECRKDDGVLDEIPAAYKDIEQVMANAADLVDIEATLKQVVCVKG